MKRNIETLLKKNRRYSEAEANHFVESDSIQRTARSVRGTTFRAAIVLMSLMVLVAGICGGCSSKVKASVGAMTFEVDKDWEEDPLTTGYRYIKWKGDSVDGAVDVVIISQADAMGFLNSNDFEFKDVTPPKGADEAWVCDDKEKGIYLEIIGHNGTYYSVGADKSIVPSIVKSAKFTD